MDEWASHLAEELAREPGLSDLADTIQAIEAAVERQWSKDYQPWFTDHGPAHSRRVAAIAAAISEFSAVRDDLRLSPLERYVLYASCWLHDVGMQELQGELVGEMAPEDYARIRHEHPARTKEALLARAAEFGLIDDPALVEAVAYVAQSHGTRYYTPSLAVLERMQLVRNLRVRGRLLAAVILIADEFDLHYERAVQLPGGGALPGVSEAHAFKHRCVRSAVPFASSSGDIGLKLELTFPDELSEDDRLAVERWICLKIQHQMGRVEAELIAGLEGQARFDRGIPVTYVAPEQPRPMPSSAAISVVRSEVAREELVDQLDALARAKAGLEAFALVLIEGRWDPQEDSDHDGREDILNVLGHHWCAGGGQWLTSERLRLLRAGSASDVLEEWATGAGASPSPPSAANELQRRHELLQVLGDALAAEPAARWLLTMSNLDGLGPDVRWIVEQMVPALRARAEPICFAFTLGPDSALATPHAGAVAVVRAGALSADDVSAYLARYVPPDVATGQSAAGLDYVDYKRLGQSMEAEIRGRLTE